LWKELQGLVCAFFCERINNLEENHNLFLKVLNLASNNKQQTKRLPDKSQQQTQIENRKKHLSLYRI